MKKELKIIIDAKIRVPLENLNSQELLEVKKVFTFSNPDFYKLQAMGYSTYQTPLSIKLFEADEQHISIPRGSMERLQVALPDRTFIIEDRRLVVPLSKKIATSKKMKFWSVQESAIQAGISKEQGLIHGVCGSGKTEILLGIFERLQQKTLVVVHTKVLLEQWIERAKRFSNVKIGVLGDGKKSIGDLTIGIWRTVYNMLDEVKNQFGLVINDEVHHASSALLHKLMNEFPAKYRIGATATIKRKDRKEFIVYAVFGNVISKITDADLLDVGKIHDVQFIVVPTEFKSQNYVREIIDPATGDVVREIKNYHALLEDMLEDRERNKLILSLIQKESSAGRKCLVIADMISHCLFWKDILDKSKIKTGLMIGHEDYKEERIQAPKDLKQGKISCIVASPVAREGFDVPELDVAYILTPAASNSAKLQQQSGRVKRIFKGKESAKCYYIWDRNVSGFQRHLKIIQEHFNKVKILRVKNAI